MPTIYFAAGLFNAPDVIFNALLYERLIKEGYEVFSPKKTGLNLVD